MENQSSFAEASQAENSPVLAAMTMIILVTSVSANICICVAFGRTPKLRNNFNYYLLNLSISDILFAIFGMSQFFITMLFGYYPFGYFACSFWLYADWFFSAATENIMMLVSLDRLVSIYCPIHYRNRQTSKYSIVALSGMWIWLNVLILPSLLLARIQGSVPDNGICQIDYSVHQKLITTSVVLVFWLPEAVTVISYILIAAKMKEKRQALINAGKAKSNGDSLKLSEFIIFVWLKKLYKVLRIN